MIGCDFSADETCTLLAQLIQTAPKLDDCYFRDQCEKRKIKVFFDVAKSDQKPGSIKFTYLDTKETFFTIPTQRTEKVKLSFFQ